MALAVIPDNDLQQLIEQAVKSAFEEHKPARIPSVMTKAQLAEYLGVPKSRVSRYMKQGMPYRKEGDDYPEFYKKEVDRWLDERFSEVQGQAHHRKGQELV